MLEDEDGLGSGFQLDRQTVEIMPDQLALDPFAVKKANLDGLAFGPLRSDAE
jgi:hypothetical protein